MAKKTTITSDTNPYCRLWANGSGSNCSLQCDPCKQVETIKYSPPNQPRPLPPKSGIGELGNFGGGLSRDVYPIMAGRPSMGKYVATYMDEMNKRYLACMEEVLTKVLQQVLEREPTEEDWSECRRITNRDFPDKFYFIYRNQQLGWVRTINEGVKITVTFIPDQKKPGELISF